jgi:hypothetical protein
MSWTCSTRDSDEKCTQIFIWKTLTDYTKGYSDVDDIILNQILKTYCVTVYTGFTWFRIKSSGGFLVNT